MSDIINNTLSQQQMSYWAEDYPLGFKYWFTIFFETLQQQLLLKEKAVEFGMLKAVNLLIIEMPWVHYLDINFLM